MKISRRVSGTFCLALLFWLALGWGLAVKLRAENSTDRAVASLGAAFFLVVFGGLLVRIGWSARRANATATDTLQFGLILIAAALTGGLLSVGFVLLDTLTGQ